MTVYLYATDGHGMRLQPRDYQFDAYCLQQALDDIGLRSGPVETTQPEGGTWVQSGIIPQTGAEFTALHWWDRQGDTRGNSHTCLAAWGKHTAADLLAAGHRDFPRAFRVEPRLDLYAPPERKSGDGWTVGPVQEPTHS